MHVPVDNPGRLFDGSRPNEHGAADFMIVLNQPILCKESFRRCYDAAQWRLNADGGANRVRDLEDASKGDFLVSSRSFKGSARR